MDLSSFFHSVISVIYYVFSLMKCLLDINFSQKPAGQQMDMHEDGHTTMHTHTGGSCLSHTMVKPASCLALYNLM